jgi:2-dehydropantoate 2-reductase
MSEQLKIDVLGAGAMGSLFGGLLAEAGHRVTLLDVNPRQLQAVRADGLLVTTDKGARRIAVSICRPEDEGEPPDWLIVFTKTTNTIAALEASLHRIGSRTHLLTLQNGIGNAEKLAGFVPLERVAVGVTTVPADLVSPGEVHSHGLGKVRMAMANGADCEKLQSLASALISAGLPAEVDHMTQVAIWEKVAFNAALNSICAVTKLTVGQLGADIDGRDLAHAVAKEVLRIAEADGLAVSEGRTLATLDHAMDTHLSHKPSMLQDLIAGRPTEIDAINGAAVEWARRRGVHTPITETLRTLVRLIERMPVI